MYRELNIDTGAVLGDSIGHTELPYIVTTGHYLSSIQTDWCDFLIAVRGVAILNCGLLSEFFLINVHLALIENLVP